MGNGGLKLKKQIKKEISFIFAFCFLHFASITYSLFPIS